MEETEAERIKRELMESIKCGEDLLKEWEERDKMKEKIRIRNENIRKI